MNKIECSRIASNGRIEIMPRDVLRYPYVFEKSARGKKCLFYRNLKLCPRAVFLKMLPVGAILWGPNNSRFGSFIKILKISLYCQ